MVKSVLERARNKFQVASAEVEDMDAHERAVLAFVCVANSSKHVESVLAHVADFVAENAPVVDRRSELVHLHADEMELGNAG